MNNPETPNQYYGGNKPEAETPRPVARPRPRGENETEVESLRRQNEELEWQLEQAVRMFELCRNEVVPWSHMPRGIRKSISLFLAYVRRGIE